MLVGVVTSIACNHGNGLPLGRADAAHDGNAVYSDTFGGGGSDAGGVSGTGGLRIDLDMGSGISTGGARGGDVARDQAPTEPIYPPDGSACGDEYHYPLWQAIADAAGASLGHCEPPKDGWVEDGHIVVDESGRVVDNSRFGCEFDGGCNYAGLASWLAGLSAYRWPCYAGQTIAYVCMVMG